MVQMIVRLTAMTGHADRLIEALHARMRQTRGVNRCVNAHIAADVDEGNVFWYWEEWDNDQALETDIASERFSQLLELMEMSASTPVLEFRVIGEKRGLEYITATRDRRA